MDDRRFDQLTRALGGASTRRGALAALAALASLGVGAATGGSAVGAKRKRRKCDPACAAGQTCQQGTCTCDNGGTVCGASCCTGGQQCEAGQCLAVPAQCIAAGERCKGVGRPCCDGLACGSGQAGKGDIACYVPAGGACETTADCVYDSQCTGGVCVANELPTPTPPTPRCTSTFAPTGDPIADGATLKSLVEDPTGPAKIVLAAGTYQPATGQFAALWIARPLEIAACEGERVVIDARQLGRVMYMSSFTPQTAVTLRGIEVVNGKTIGALTGEIGNAAGIYVQANIALTLDGVSVANNQALKGASQNVGAGAGAGISVDYGSNSLTLVGKTVVRDNVGDSTTSYGKGNGITIYGGTLTCSDPGPVVCGNGNPASSSLAQNCYGLDGSLNPLTFPANCGCAAGNCG